MKGAPIGAAMSPASKKDHEKEEMEWRAESDLRSLIEAEKIKADPERMKRAMKKRDDMKKALTNIKDN